jgi:hypothetical protein
MAIDGYAVANYNSNEWQSTTFVAPRAAWITVKYDFNADKRR